MPRNEKLRADDVAAALLKARGLVSLAARQLGVTPKTVRRYIEQYATVREAREQAREELCDLAEGRLFNAITEGRSWAIKYFLSTQAHDRGYNLQAITAGLLKGMLQQQVTGLEEFLSATDYGDGGRN